MRKPLEFEDHPLSYERARSEGYFRAFCRHVVDGDTLDALIDLGMGKFAYDPIRLHDVDTPEIFHPANSFERQHGLQARDRVIALVLNKPIAIKTWKDAETFGRYVADVVYFGASNATYDLAKTLRAEGLIKRESYP